MRLQGSRFVRGANDDYVLKITRGGDLKSYIRVTDDSQVLRADF
ncbi:MAG TPA: hypothetical protein PLY87_21300 [Planctomycetaceae bacterium]|nr:hypothetical protein [Planctomycetaceae bacterium]HQZ67646.1 hypothetical protein [Planctomycetaceae bacterium]